MRFSKIHWQTPLLIAVILTLCNAVKPAVVDDTAYLLLARHISQKPLDPYGVELFWYSHPQPAMQILAPPVLPYWLALGIRIFGEHLFILKLWLFPFSLLLCFSSQSLLKRFSPKWERTGLWMLVLGAGVLPLFNFMLDIPALAIGVTAIALFVRGSIESRFLLVALAGVLIGLAMQTKYTTLTIPGIILWYGLLNRRLRYALSAIILSLLTFWSWELFLFQIYGESHFVFHVRDQSGGTSTIAEKAQLFRPLLGHLGGLAVGWMLFIGRGVGLSQGFVRIVAVLVCLGWLAVSLIPTADAVLLRDNATGTPKLDLPAIVFYTPAIMLMIVLSVTIGMLGFRPWGHPLGLIRYGRVTWFLIGWLTIELLGYFALTPFPAGRRVVPYIFVAGLLACHLVSRITRIRPERCPDRWIPVYSVCLGFTLFAIDCWDALPERQLAVHANDVVQQHPHHQTWTQGHWGWQFYCDRAGMKLVVPGRSQLQTGDWLVIPIMPDETGFYRPYHGEAKFTVDPGSTEFVMEITWLDGISAQTIPNLYGGNVPILGRKATRLRIAIYRVTQDWIPVP